jgi:hypothetical protein
VRRGKLAGELVQRVLADVPGSGVQPSGALLGQALAIGAPHRPGAFDRSPVGVVAAGVALTALSVRAALQAPERALGSGERPRILDRLTGAEDREMPHARVNAEDRRCPSGWRSV